MKLSENDIATVAEIARSVFDEMNAGDFCSCYEGDIFYEYNDGAADFIEKLTEKLKAYQKKK